MTTATTKTTTITSKTTTIATKTKTTQPRINTAAECYLRVYIVVYAALQSWHSILERPEEAAAAWTFYQMSSSSSSEWTYADIV